MNESSIEHAAKSALEDVNRTSYSDKPIPKELIDGIARAIAKAIAEYDKQK